MLFTDTLYIARNESGLLGSADENKEVGKACRRTASLQSASPAKRVRRQLASGEACAFTRREQRVLQFLAGRAGTTSWYNEV